METNVQQADWWRRLLALVVDTAVLWLPMWVLTRSMDRPVRLLVATVVGVVYFALLNGGAKGQTLGARYQLVDRKVRRGATYTYRLQLVGRSGAHSWYTIRAVVR